MQDVRAYLCSASFAMLTACGPTAQLAVMPQALCPGDTVHLSWHVRGDPELLLRVGDARPHGSVDSVNPQAMAPDTLDFLLVARARGKEATREMAILRFGATGHTVVVLPTHLAGDTVVATGEKNNAVWQQAFEVVSILSASSR